MPFSECHSIAASVTGLQCFTGDFICSPLAASKSMTFCRPGIGLYYKMWERSMIYLIMEI